MSLCNDSICIFFLKWKATAIIQLLVFPQTRAIKLTEKKNVPYLSVSSTGVPLPPRPHQQPYPLYSNAQRRVAQCIIPPNWSKFLFACFKEVPVKSIMKITLGWQVFCHTSYIKALLSASNQYATRIRPRPHVSGDFCIAIFFLCGSDAQWSIAQSIISLTWNKFLFTCFKEVPVKLIAKITQRYIVIRELLFSSWNVSHYEMFFSLWNVFN